MPHVPCHPVIRSAALLLALALAAPAGAVPVEPVLPAPFEIAATGPVREVQGAVCVLGPGGCTGAAEIAFEKPVPGLVLSVHLLDPESRARLVLLDGTETVARRRLGRSGRIRLDAFDAITGIRLAAAGPGRGAVFALAEQPHPVPLPGALPLLASALAVLAFLARRRPRA